MNKFIFLLILLSLAVQAFAKGPKVQEGYKVIDPLKKNIFYLKSHYDLVIDHVDERGYEVYGPFGLKKYLDDLGLVAFDLSIKNKNADSYPSPKEVEEKLKELESENPDIISLFSIGTTLKGRNLWMVKISDNVEQDELEPEFKYIANMHGDEIVGRELMVELIKDLAKSYRENKKNVTSLINNTEIYIMPSMNPDGAANKRRGNGDWTDLNRDFPDFTTGDNQNSPDGREPETKALMEFQKNRNFSLSANFSLNAPSEL